jgi:hypothetical protein
MRVFGRVETRKDGPGGTGIPASSITHALLAFSLKIEGEKVLAGAGGPAPGDFAEPARPAARKSGDWTPKPFAVTISAQATRGAKQNVKPRLAMSQTNPLHPCEAEKPELYESVQLYFDDEHQTTGRWTGRFWWSHGHEVAPACWQYFEPHFTGAPQGARGSRR